MFADHGGKTAQKALRLVAAALLGLAAIAVVPASGAQAVDQETAPTFIICKKKPAKGRIDKVVAVGPGKIWIRGTILPCRPAGPRDAAAIAEIHADSSGFVAGGPGIVHYRRTASGQFSRIITLTTNTRRVCVADHPDNAVDCYSVRVPERNGMPGVPIVLGRTTTAGVTVPPPIGLCGYCW